MGIAAFFRIALVGAFGLALALPSWAAEANCTDGANDDSDGRIDCLDGDCSRDPACRQSVTRTFELHRTNPTDPTTRWGDVYYVSWPDVPDIPDRGSAGGNACAVPGDGVIDSRNAACLILSGVDPAVTLSVVVSKFDPETCSFIGTNMRGNSNGATGASVYFPLPPHLGLIVTLSSSAPGPALPSSTVLLEGWPDPEWIGEPVIATASGCTPEGHVLQIPYDTLYRKAEGELDPVKRAALYIRMNDLVCGDGYLIPLMFRLNVSALGAKLMAPMTGWDLDMSTLAEWYRTA